MNNINNSERRLIRIAVYINSITGEVLANSNIECEVMATISLREFDNIILMNGLKYDAKIIEMGTGVI